MYKPAFHIGQFVYVTLPGQAERGQFTIVGEWSGVRSRVKAWTVRSLEGEEFTVLEDLIEEVDFANLKEVIPGSACFSTCYKQRA